MKNIFKSLMLVAVAAMAFTACQKDNEEINKTEQTRVVKFTATIGEDDTRSGFTEKVGNAYKSAWDGGEWILAYLDYSGEKYITDIDNKGNFSLEISENDTAATFYAPSVSWSNLGNGEYIPDSSMFTTQTPRENSVDPNAHLLRADDITVSDSNVAFTMEHVLAYGKMTVEVTDFTISKVVIKLNGTWEDADKNYTYTLNATNVKNNVFWFATYPIEVSSFTVEAYDSEGNIMATTKPSLPAEGKGSLKFQTGRVSTFAVSGLTEQETPTAPIFTSASETNYYSSQDRVLSFTGDTGTLEVNLCYVFDGNSIKPGEYTEEYSETGYIYIMYQGEYCTKYNGNGINTGKIIVSIVNGNYFIEFIDLKGANDEMVLEYATFSGMIADYILPDPREKLETPASYTPVVKGKMVTLSWSDVEGADGYYLYCAYDTSIKATTQDTSIEFEMPNYNTYYYFMIKAIANDDNPNYKDSEETYLQGFTTGAEPVGDVSFTSAVATYNPDNTNWYNITFTDSSSRALSFTIGNGGVNYWEAGTWNSNNWYGANALGLASFNGKDNIVINAVVSIVDSAYKIDLSWDGGVGTYIGQIEGFIIPDENSGSEEPDPENPGEGGDATESFENWVFSASLDQGAKLITVTDGTHTVTFTINAIVGGTFKIGGYGALYAYSVTVNGEPAESASGTIQMDSATGYKIRLDAEINGVKYTGTSTNAVV